MTSNQMKETNPRWRSQRKVNAKEVDKANHLLFLQLEGLELHLQEKSASSLKYIYTEAPLCEKEKDMLCELKAATPVGVSSFRQSLCTT